MFQQNNFIPIGDNKQKTILVIEDDDSIGALLVEILSQETTYDTVLVPDGLQALKLFHAVKPCLVITDYRLPYMDGIEFYDCLHAQSADTPTIIMSAYLPEEEIRKRSLVGLNKPFELDELLDIVEDLLAPSTSAAFRHN